MPIVTSTSAQTQSAETNLFDEFRRMRDSGNAQGAMALLRQSLRRNPISPEGFEKAGRTITKLLRSESDGTVRVLIVGQCTTNWISHCSTAAAWRDGIRLICTDGQYDNILQELAAATHTNDRYDAVVLLPWNTKLLSGNTLSIKDRIDQELGFWKQAWHFVTDQLQSRMIQVGYDWTNVGPMGFHMGGRYGGPVALVRQVNELLKESLPPNAFFVDLDQISGVTGREAFYNSRRYFWTKQPFSELGAARLSEHLWASLRSMLVGPKKVLVLDLDNTVWGGVVGEVGPQGIEIGDNPTGEAFRAIQAYAKELTKRGCLLAVCSKNNPADAREPFEKNSSMILSLDDFAAFEASWDPKAEAIKRIAQTLNLGIDSFVFVDDNPAEREHVRQMLPEVEVVELPQDPSDYVQAIEASLFFEATNVTDEDSERAKQYAVESKRREIASTFASMDDYLVSLDMIADIRPINEEDLPRVVQLLSKTNQFNLTTRRHNAEIVSAMLADPSAIGLSLRLSDRFGDYGLVAVVIAVPVKDKTPLTLHIDSWLMSCRVIGRTVEEYCLNALLSRAQQLNAHILSGTYVPTKKNGLVKDLLDRLGFQRGNESPDGTVDYMLDLTISQPAKTLVATFSS